MIGQTLTHYRVTAKLGQGGMGEVYRATDTKLDRQVAIKVLPANLTQSRESIARFEREAKTLTTLNHPNIAAIYGFDTPAETHFLVMELVEGETLDQRLKRGPLPVEEAIDVCRQIAEALEAAHEKGIIHRDLKPANVKVTPEGKVQVLDFGLAKAMGDGPSTTSVSPALEDSPTLVESLHPTRPGVILGTAAYMSPEQARGKPVDKRSDIWSFGVVLFECLTGQRLFSGESVSDILAGVLKSEIDWKLLPTETPAPIRWLLRKCLTRERKQRLHEISDARVDLERALADPTLLAPESSVRRADRRSLALMALSCALVRMFHTFSRRNNSFSLTPCFSWVFGSHDDQNRFNGFCHTFETVETVPVVIRSPITQLKQGVNERLGARRRKACEISWLRILHFGEFQSGLLPFGCKILQAFDHSGKLAIYFHSATGLLIGLGFL